MSRGGTTKDYFREVWANAVLAMALHQLRQTDEASTALEQAVAIADKHLTKADASDFGGGWDDWLVAQILLREARLLVQSSAVYPAK